MMKKPVQLTYGRWNLLSGGKYIPFNLWVTKVRKNGNVASDV